MVSERTSDILTVTMFPSQTIMRPSTTKCLTFLGPASNNAAGSQLPAESIPEISQIARSPRAPTGMRPPYGRPRISAPPRVASSSASIADIASAPLLTRWSNIA